MARSRFMQHPLQAVLDSANSACLLPAISRQQSPVFDRILMTSQFLKFATVGGIATVTQYVILYALVSGAAWEPANASMLGAAIGALVNYWLNYTFSFKSERRHRESFPLFVLMASCGTVLNGLIVK